MFKVNLRKRGLALMLSLCLLALSGGALAAGDVVTDSFEAAAQGRHLTLPGPMLDYLLAHTEGGRVALPDLSKLKTRGLAAYEGEDPAAYLTAFAQAVALKIEELPPLEETLPLPASAADQAALAKAFATLLTDYEAWMAEALSAAKVYPALTRMVLDLGEDADLWKQASFTDKNQKPIYKSGVGRTLKKSSKGQTVRQVQQALVDLGYLSKVDGEYGSKTVTAVEEYQADEGLEVTGELTPQEQRRLLGLPEPVTLMQLAVQEADLDEDAAQWWGAYLASLQDIHWEGSTLTFSFVDYSDAYDEILAEMIQGYNAGEYGMGCMPNNIAAKTALVGERSEAIPVEIQVSLQPLLEGGTPEEMISAENFTLLGYGFDSYAWPVEGALEEAMAYAEANIPPVAFPKSGAIMKPPSGSSKFIIQNGNSSPIYAKIYQASGPNDLSTDVLVGTAFINAGGSASMKIKPGYYHVHYGVGDTWYGETAMFGDEGWYNCCEESYQFLKNYEHTLSIQISETSGDDTYYDPISRDSM